MKNKIVIIIGTIAIFLLGYIAGIAVGIYRLNVHFFSKSNSNIIEEAVVEQEEEIPKEFHIDRYKLLGNSKIKIKDEFKQESYNEIIDNIYNYKSTIILEDANIEYYMDLAINNNIFINMLVKGYHIEQNDKTLSIDYTYTTKEEHDEKLEKAEQIIKSILINATSDDSNEFEKVLYIYSYMAENVVNDSDAAENGKELSISDVLFEHKGTYKNYSKMINYLLTQLEIESYTVYGDTIFTEPHEWNLVKIYNKYYQVDATYESETTQGKGLIYFGMTKGDILAEGKVITDWADGFVYDDYSDQESDKLQILKNAVKYKIENDNLILYNFEGKEYARINTNNLEQIGTNEPENGGENGKQN